jgi:aromatic-L-amino-acid decarboxylase
MNHARASAIAPELEALRERRAPLTMSSAAFRQIGHRLVDDVADRLAGIAAGPVTHDESVGALRALLDADGGLPPAGSDAGPLVSDATALLFDHSLFNGHPRFFGYVTSSPAPIGMSGDFLASALNQNVGARQLAPLATEIERQTVRWIAELIGYPPDAGGLLVSGGNMANFVGFVAARAAKAPWDVRKEGLSQRGSPRLLVYASGETHGWLRKAADLFGLGTDAIRWIPAGAGQRMDVAALQRRIDEDVRLGHHPFLVVGTAGAVGTGAVDALPEIAAICRAHGLWFHVDGAYGGLAARAPGAPADLLALSEADSVAVDPHKWLYAPLEAGCALVRDAEALRHAFSYHASYYHFDDELNYFDYGPQNSRGFRALKVWLALRQVGRAGYLEMIADDMRLARHLHALVARHPAFEAASQNLSITTFRYVPPDLRPRLGEPAVEDHLERLNQALLTSLEKSGRAFLSNAVVGGRFMLRACVVNFHTTLGDIEALPPLLARLGRAADASITRPPFVIST